MQDTVTEIVKHTLESIKLTAFDVSTAHSLRLFKFQPKQKK